MILSVAYDILLTLSYPRVPERELSRLIRSRWQPHAVARVLAIGSRLTLQVGLMLVSRVSSAVRTLNSK